MKDKSKEILSYFVGAELHDIWRKNRILEDGTYEPRIKETDDEEWIKENGTDKVDIANKSFKELPDDWQKENLEAGKVAVNLVFDDAIKDKSCDHKVESFSSDVHEAWLERNKWADGTDLDVPYEQLPEDEKSKDRVQVLEAIEAIDVFAEGKIDLFEVARKFDENVVEDWNKVFDSKIDLNEKNVDFFNQIDAKGLTAIDVAEARGDLIILSDLIDKGALSAEELKERLKDEIESMKNEIDNGKDLDN